MKKRKILVTSALPYANGSIHIGHLVEYIQTDIWVRYQKLRGHECRYMCADDTHGTPIMLSARRAGKGPEELIKEMYEEHTKDFRDFHIEFDNYYTTHSPENRMFAEYIYARAREGGHIDERDVEQYFCPECGIFLPDRLILGTCPGCGAEEQYGDACEVCSSTYEPTDLSNPRCAECGTAPVRKLSKHYFFKLGDFTGVLKKWVREGHVQSEVKNKLEEWFAVGLKDWDISRDAPYFGFKIPDTEDKYFYVWLDAPIGYMASTKNWCDQHGRDYKEFWQSEDSEIYHFIGKDIVYFHTLFWPAMLMAAGFKTPDKVFVHGFLTVNGRKMSKSRGTFIKARTYLKHLDPEFLRYYYATKLSSSVADVDLSLNDFVYRVNSDVVNKVLNLGSRLASLVNKKLDGKLGKLDDDGKNLIGELRASLDVVARNYESLEYHRAVKEIVRLAEVTNKYIDDRAPWEVVKSDPEKCRAICTAGLNALRLVTGMLKPVIPRIAADVEKFLNIEPLTWGDLAADLENHKITQFSKIATRVEQEQVEALIQDSRESLQEKTSPSGEKTAVGAREAGHEAGSGTPGETGDSSTTGGAGVKIPAREEVEPLQPEITIDEFNRIDVRVGVVLSAEKVEGARKLLKLKVDIGKLGIRQVFAGMSKAYKPEELVGRKVLLVANLKPRKMKFGLSEGMILAAGAGGKDIFLLSVDEGAQLGDRVH